MTTAEILQEMRTAVRRAREERRPSGEPRVPYHGAFVGANPQVLQEIDGYCQLLEMSLGNPPSPPVEEGGGNKS